MSEHVTAYSGFPRQRTVTRPWRAVSRFLGLMLEARRTRGILAELDPRLLKDIGVTRSEARDEVARAAWDFEPRPRFRR